MTTPQTPPRSGVAARVDRREEVLAAYNEHGWHRVGGLYRCLCGFIPDNSLAMSDHRADTLLPLIARFEREAAAKALEQAILIDRTTVAKLSPVERLTCYLVRVEDLVTRAADLRAAALTDVDGVQS